MRATLYRSEDHAELDRIVANFQPHRPVVNEQGQRIGSVSRVWREGDLVMADLECVPEDVPAKTRKRKPLS